MATKIPDWTKTGNAWRVFVLGAHRFPDDAIVRVTGGRGRDLDVKKEKGKNLPSITDNGLDASDPKITIRCPTPKCARIVNKILDKLDPASGIGLGEPIQIVHPSPNCRGVTRVRIRRISFPEIQNDYCVFVVDCIEHNEPKTPVVAPYTGNGAVPSDEEEEPPADPEPAVDYNELVPNLWGSDDSTHDESPSSDDNVDNNNSFVNPLGFF